MKAGTAAVDFLGNPLEKEDKVISITRTYGTDSVFRKGIIKDVMENYIAVQGQAYNETKYRVYNVETKRTSLKSHREVIYYDWGD